MAKVTAVKFGTSPKDFGDFKVEKFSMFDDDDLARYADLRNRMADVTKGLKHDFTREYSRKTTTCTGEGDDRVYTTTEEIILVVHYWEKPVSRHKGESDEDVRDNEDAILPR